MPTNCLSVFDHFVGFALKGLASLPPPTLDKNYFQRPSLHLNLHFKNGPFSYVALNIFVSSTLAQGNPMNESVCMNGPKKLWKTAFKKCESVWSAKANHIPTNFL